GTIPLAGHSTAITSDRLSAQACGCRITERMPGERERLRRAVTVKSPTATFRFIPTAPMPWPGRLWRCWTFDQDLMGHNLPFVLNQAVLTLYLADRAGN